MGRTTGHIGLLTMATLLAFVRATPAGDAAGHGGGELTDWLHMADDADPDVRVTGRQHLFGLAFDELPALRDAARRFKPMSPELEEALQDVVRQVYTRHTLMQWPVRKAGMLGVRWRDPVSPVFGPNDTGDDIDRASVDVRLPGYVAYRYLESGDRVLAILTGNTEVRIGTNSDLGREIRNFAPGDVIGLRVLRGGRLMTITLPLDGHVAEFDDGQSEAEKNFIDGTLQKAETDAAAYFRREFVGVSGNS